MVQYHKNLEYMNIVKNILDNDEFKKLEDYKHHGDNRMTHCIRVSYYSFILAKKLKLDFKATAKAGLLHDFFFVNNQELDFITRTKVLFTHPKMAVNNSKRLFNISELEEDIIATHMFPIGLNIPKHRESWLVNIVDDYCSVYERVVSTLVSIKAFFSKFKKKRVIYLLKR